MSRPSRWFARAACAFALVITAGTAAPAATLVWQNAAGGAAGVAGNWNPVQVPADVDVLRWDLANTYDVNFFASVDSVATHLIYGGDVTFDFNAPHGLRTGFHVAQVGPQVATARIVDGTLRLGPTVSVGAGAGALGTLRIAGGTADVFQNSGTGTPVFDVGGNAASAGTGEVVVINGGVLEIAGQLNLGRNFGSLGTLRVKGAGPTGAGSRRSHFFADAGDAVLGMNASHGVLEVLEGGQFRVGRALRVAEGPASIGEITVGGENAIDSSEVHVEGDLLLGANFGVLPGGTATLTLDSLGVLIVDDSTVVGDPDGSAAIITMAKHTRLKTKHLIQQAGGTLDFGGGALQVDGGMLVTESGRLTIPGNSEGQVYRPTLWMINGASGTFAGKSTTHAIGLGTTGKAVMYLSGGSSVTASGGQIELGSTAGSDGRIFMLDGTLTADQRAVIGAAGTGLLYVSEGDVLVDGMDLGASAAGSGSLLTFGTATAVTSTGPLNVGGTTLAAGGVGSVVVDLGSRLDLTAPLVAGTVWESGTFDVNASEANLTGLLTVRGGFHVESGASVNGGAIGLRGNGTITGDGAIHSGILAGTDTTVSITAEGTLQIGTDASSGNVLHRGTLDVGAHAVSVSDPDSSILGVVSMAGGELHLSSGGGVIEAGKRLTGNGAIHGPLVVRGYLTSVGPNPIDVYGTLTGVGQGVGGKKLHFFPGSRFEGSGAINAEIETDTGSVIHATGFLEVGKVNTAAPILRGRIETGGNGVVLRWISDVNVAGQIALDGGWVSASFAMPIHLLAGSRVEGSGSFFTPILAAGTIAPGNSAGCVRIHGTLTAAGGTLEMELGDHAAGEHDTLDVEGLALLGGTLDLRRLPTFAAAAGDSFRIVQADSVSGTFAGVTLDGLPIAGQVEVHYAADGVWVVVLDGTLAVGDDPVPAAPAPALRFAAWASPGPRPGVELALPAASSVAIRLYDVTGREVAALHEGVLAAGRHRFDLPRAALGAGVYFARAVVEEQGRVMRRTVRIIRVR